MSFITVLTVKAGQLIFVGTCLSIGFWAGKRLTNRLDAFLVKHSQEVKQYQAVVQGKPTCPQEL